MHGDESGIITSVEKAVALLQPQLPDFVFIPIASPTAVEAKTRANINGIDLNRSFFDDTTFTETRNVMRRVWGHKFDLCISFHEDPTCKDFYMYDAFGPNIQNSPQLNKLQFDLASIGIHMFNGVDDPFDPALKLKIENGYHYSPPSNKNESGFFSDWAYVHGIIKRFINPEIPGKLPQEKKDAAVEVVIRNFSLSLLSPAPSEEDIR